MKLKFKTQTEVYELTKDEVTTEVTAASRNAGKIVQRHGEEWLKRMPSIQLLENGNCELSIEYQWAFEGWPADLYPRAEV